MDARLSRLFGLLAVVYRQVVPTMPDARRVAYSRTMCYSAMVWADYRRYVRAFGAMADIKEFVDLYRRRAGGERISIPKGMDEAFAFPETAEQCEISELIERYNADAAEGLERELFAQKARLAEAERKLSVKHTKAAAESQRIATAKMDRCLSRLADLKRIEIKARDSRIYPGHYAPVMVIEDERRVVKPMRYQCRPAGKPAFYDSRYPGTYNARRDNLEGFWKELFGFSHGVMVVNAFYENVSIHRAEGRELAEGEEPQNVVLEYRPRATQDMLVACLWSRWTGRDQPDLLSFAAITDEPPAEVSAAGHDRCIVALRSENIDSWLSPSPDRRDLLYAILDERERPYYEHRKAA